MVTAVTLDDLVLGASALLRRRWCHFGDGLLPETDGGRMEDRAPNSPGSKVDSGEIQRRSTESVCQNKCGRIFCVVQQGLLRDSYPGPDDQAPR